MSEQLMIMKVPVVGEQMTGDQKVTLLKPQVAQIVLPHDGTDIQATPTSDDKNTFVPMMIVIVAIVLLLIVVVSWRRHRHSH